MNDGVIGGADKSKRKVSVWQQQMQFNAREFLEQLLVS